MQKFIRQTGKTLLTSAGLLRQPLYHRPGHFYSPVAGASDVERAKAMRSELSDLAGVDLRGDAQLNLVSDLAPKWSQTIDLGPRYRIDNRMYGLADGAVYYSMLLHLSPHRIIEVGSGFSSALALDVRDRHLPGLELTFIEPHPDRLLGLLSPDDRNNTQLLRSPVQDAPLDIYEQLHEGDILFIDSTHVAKAGSDVNWLFFHVLPRLRPGVIVHVHDIFFPFEYPDHWLDERRSWNENYLLRAFLTHSDTFEIMLFSSWLWEMHPELVTKYLPQAAAEQPGNIWLRKIR